VPKALRNYGKPKIPVFLMGGEDCILMYLDEESKRYTYNPDVS
jgi:hypothetical protein